LISWLFLSVSLIGAGFTANALRPLKRPATLAMFSFLAGWMTTELALQHLIWQAVASAGFIALGALDSWPGQLGLGMVLFSWAGLLRLIAASFRTSGQIENALVAGLGPEYRTEAAAELREHFDRPISWGRILRLFPIRHPDVVRHRDIVFATHGHLELKLDVYQHRDQPKDRPVVLYVHGGGWVIGDKKHQGHVTMNHMAARGWVGVSIDYRLSPRATFPDHLIDVKRAIKWVREHIAEYGGDAAFVALCGGSAGGHLSALAALTPNDAEYQPGFEEVDTEVQACVPYYGIFDFTDRFGHWPNPGMARMLERLVLKVSRSVDPDAFRKASPIDHIGAEAPPFMVVQGDCDVLVPVEEARQFVSAFRQQTDAPIVYAEIVGGQHAFEVFPSIRSALFITGVERFLAVAHARQAQSSEPEAQSSA
jgi:acetyl esterase/lipase